MRRFSDHLAKRLQHLFVQLARPALHIGAFRNLAAPVSAWRPCRYVPRGSELLPADVAAVVEVRKRRIEDSRAASLCGSVFGSDGR